MSTSHDRHLLANFFVAFQVFVHEHVIIAVETPLKKAEDFFQVKRFRSHVKVHPVTKYDRKLLPKSFN